MLKRSDTMNVYVLLIVFSLCYGVNSQARCTTPNGEQGICRNIYNCRIFLQALRKKTPTVIQFLRQSTCSISDSGYPLVCCGNVADYGTITQPTRTPPTRPTTPSGNGGGGKSIIIPGEGPAPGTRFQINPLVPGRDVCGESEIADEIVEGSVTKIGEFPWMALLQHRKNDRVVPGYNCAGALINDRYVVTTAHCVYGAVQRELGDVFQVRLGEWDIRQGIDCPPGEGCNDAPVDVMVEQAIYHADYQKGNNEVSNRYHDIALIRLAEPVEFTKFIKPICLPNQGERANSNEIVHSAGWTYIVSQTGESSPIKLKVNMTIFDQDQCANIYKQNNGVDISDSQLCAIGTKRKNSCNGNSGVPLMKRVAKTSLWYIEGVVAFGPMTCYTEGVPGIYTRIYAYMEWIRANMRP